jgi:hypothetical protein
MIRGKLAWVWNGSGYVFNILSSGKKVLPPDLNESANRLVDKKIDGQKDRRVERWMDRKIDGSRDRCTEIQTVIGTDGWKDRLIQRQTDRKTDGQKDRRTER